MRHLAPGRLGPVGVYLEPTPARPGFQHDPHVGLLAYGLADRPPPLHPAGEEVEGPGQGETALTLTLATTGAMLWKGLLFCFLAKSRKTRQGGGPMGIQPLAHGAHAPGVDAIDAAGCIRRSRSPDPPPSEPFRCCDTAGRLTGSRAAFPPGPAGGPALRRPSAWSDSQKRPTPGPRLFGSPWLTVSFYLPLKSRALHIRQQSASMGATCMRECDHRAGKSQRRKARHGLLIQGTGEMTNDPINASTQPGEPGSPFTNRRGPVGLGPALLSSAPPFAGTFAAGALISTVAPAAAEAVAVAQAGMGMGMHGGNPAAMHAMMEAHLDRMLASVGASADQSSRHPRHLRQRHGDPRADARPDGGHPRAVPHPAHRADHRPRGDGEAAAPSIGAARPGKAASWSGADRRRPGADPRPAGQAGDADGAAPPHGDDAGRP